MLLKDSREGGTHPAQNHLAMIGPDITSSTTTWMSMAIMKNLAFMGVSFVLYPL